MSGGGLSGGATDRFLIGGEGVNSSLNAEFRQAIFTGAGPTAASDTLAQLTIDFAFTITRLRNRVRANSKNADSVIAFRDDGSSVASVTIGAAATGEFDSGALTVSVASGSLVNWLIDTTASASGSLSDEGLIIECES